MGFEAIAMMKSIIVLLLASIAVSTATTCTTAAIATCQGAITVGTCATYQTYVNCYSSCASNSAECAVLNAYIPTINTILNTLGCTITNPCSTTPTPTPAVTTSRASQTVSFGTTVTQASYTGAEKTTFECGYFNALGQSVAGYTSNTTAMCTLTGTGCTTTTTNATFVNGTQTASASSTNTYKTGLSSVGSSFSSTRRANKVTFVGNLLSTLATTAQITAAGTSLAGNLGRLTAAISAAYTASGATPKTLTVSSIAAITQTSSAGVVAPVFGMAAAMLFAVIAY